MCGIIGIFGEKKLDLIKAGLKEMQNRGKDSSNFHSGNNYVIGHCLHSIVNHIPQPVFSKDKKKILISNCEIYNWEELNKKYKLNAKNDSELLFLLLQKKGINNINELSQTIKFHFMHTFVGLQPFRSFRKRVNCRLCHRLCIERVRHIDHRNSAYKRQPERETVPEGVKERQYPAEIVLRIYFEDHSCRLNIRYYIVMTQHDSFGLSAASR